MVRHAADRPPRIRGEIWAFWELALARTGADRSQIHAKLYTFYRWCARAEIEELTTLASTVETWWPAIAAFIDTGITNARTEGINLADQAGETLCLRVPQRGEQPPADTVARDPETPGSNSGIKSIVRSTLTSHYVRISPPSATGITTRAPAADGVLAGVSFSRTLAVTASSAPTQSHRPGATR